MTPAHAETVAQVLLLSAFAGAIAWACAQIIEAGRSRRYIDRRARRAARPLPQERP